MTKTMMQSLKDAFDRERKKRKEAERILEEKSLELYQSNQKYQELNKNLEIAVKERTRKLAESRDTAIQHSEAKSRFLANMSHEIRTPLNSIIGILELFADTTLNVKQQEFLDTLTNSSKHLLNLINDILDFSKIENSKMTLENTVVDLELLIDTVMDIEKILCKKNNNELVKVFDRNVPKLIMGDSLRLRQIIMNLVNNAIKFTKDGSITIKVFLKNNILNLHVIDTGIGIGEEGLKKIFQSFSQVHSNMAHSHGGTGLGLTITQRLIAMMGGKIEVSSEVNIGSNFSVLLPIKLPDEQELDNYNEEQSNLKKSKEINDLSKEAELNILVIDDIGLNLFVAKNLFKKLGYDIDTAESALEGIELVKAKKYDFIFTDIQMPDVNGYEFTERIINMIDTDLPKIIAMSGDVTITNRENCRESGMADFISKPVTSDKIKYVILNNLGRKAVPKLLKKNSLNENKEYLSYTTIQQYKKDIFITFIPIFKDQYIENMKEILDKFDKNKIEMKMAAHSLKGACYNIGAKYLGDLLYRIEEEYEVMSKPLFDQLITMIDFNFEETISKLNSLDDSCFDLDTN